MLERKTHGSCIQVRFAGDMGLVDPLDLPLRHLSIEDMAWSLSKKTRFSGYTDRDYSVAQHSLLVSEICEPEDALEGLLHDAAEAYLNDIPTPVKYAKGLESYRAFENEISNSLCERFCLKGIKPPSVKEADRVMFLLEQTYLMPDQPWKMENWDTIKNLPEPFRSRKPSFDRMRNLPQDSNFVRWQFLQRFDELKRG